MGLLKMENFGAAEGGKFLEIQGDFLKIMRKTKKKTDVFQFDGAAESRKILRAAEGGNFGAAKD